MKIEPTIKEMHDFNLALEHFRNARIAMLQFRSHLVLAGCGTFGTTEDYNFLLKLEKKFDKMKLKFSKKQARGMKNMPTREIMEKHLNQVAA